MGDFYLDDQFYDHPKALEAGEDAANLYVRGLAWAHRHNTPRVPKPALTTLTARANRKGLAARLVEVGLWHDMGAHWEIHDWTTRNAKSSARREQAKKAAHTRWSNAHSNAQTDGASNAQALREQYETMPNKPRNQGTKEQGTKEHSSSSSNNSQVVVDKPVDDDEVSGENGQDVVDGALGVLAGRDLASRETDKGPVGDRRSWLAEARQRRTRTHAPMVDELRSSGRLAGLSAVGLADVLDPPSPVVLVRRDYDHGRVACSRCEGVGVFTDGAGLAHRCDHLGAVGA